MERWDFAWDMVLRNEHLVALSVHSDLDSTNFRIMVYSLLSAQQLLGDSICLTSMLTSPHQTSIPLLLQLCSSFLVVVLLFGGRWAFVILGQCWARWNRVSRRTMHRHVYWPLYNSLDKIRVLGIISTNLKTPTSYVNGKWRRNPHGEARCMSTNKTTKKKAS